MRANSVFFPSSAALCRRLGTVSKPPLFSLWLSRKEKDEKKSVLLLHSQGKFVILFSVCELIDSRSERLLSPMFSTLSLPALHDQNPQTYRTVAQSLTHLRCLTFPWDCNVLYASVPLLHTIFKAHYLFIYACTPVIYSPCNLFICTFCFLGIWCTVLELGPCMLQQDVGFFLTRLISCRRRHRLIKIIPWYRGCFGQPNDTGGLLCSTGCSRLANGVPQLQLAPN